ncbi:hydrogenase 4 subunit B [Selenomonas sp. TAMA-11512]|uniref:proton-conducting transporter transmembrane domain-containing protein n=1 Tax=Selenomonas sp. TAMA-11512 TaxID=3095337 RepID=UPI003090902E|nr:hydrogenase 4 subunit B [Selenomonas sp. TAMA-11512]
MIGLIWSFVLLACGTLAMLVPQKYEDSAREVGLKIAGVASLSILFTAGGYLLGIRFDMASIFLPESEVTLLSWSWGHFSIFADAWSAAFLVILGLAGVAVSLYAVDYTKHYKGNGLRALTGLWNLFLLSMTLVLVAADAFTFILSWEIMALVSFLLVNHESEKKKTVHAAYQYMVMTHLGTAAILVSFYLLGSASENLSFAALAQNTLDYPMRHVAFFSAFIGFALKAGLMPLHIWLPNAHPAAPSHVSALMSGVMLKIALYGFGRFFFVFFGTDIFAYGFLVTAVGLISAFLGVLYATMETDMKRILAYSSVENMGIIFAAFGAGMLLSSMNLPELAVLGYTAALVHAFSHSMMKSLLFMSAGAVMQATGSKNIEQLGALFSRMPYTAIFTLIGSMALASLPFTSGLIGEWLTLQSFVTIAWQGGSEGYRLLVIAAFLLLGLTGALALGCFVRLYSVVFLGRRRSSLVLSAHEMPIYMLVGMGIEAVFIIFMGIFPAPFVLVMSEVLLGPGASAQVVAGEALYWYGSAGVSDGGSYSVFSPLILAAFGIVLTIVLMLLLRKKTLYEMRDITWNCGTDPTRREQYTATGFSKPLRRAFDWILHPRRERTFIKKAHDYFGREIHYKLEIPDAFHEKLYHPAEQVVVRLANTIRRIQQGSVRLYIGYTMVAMLLVLLWGLMR